jgi:endonuclease-3
MSRAGRGPTTPTGAGAAKRPFDIHEAMQRIRAAVDPLPKAVLFELAEGGFASAFEILVACIITIRTREEVSWQCARRLFALARSPAAMSQLSPAAIDEAIAACSFHEAKARQIHAIARQLVAAHNGLLPCDEAVIRSFHGVGPKCANLVLGIACQQPRIGVDIHVHRASNRWGYVQAPTPEATMAALEATLPRQYWVEINRLLVPFGKHICTGRLPHCSTCPVLDMCQQVGVEAHR